MKRLKLFIIPLLLLAMLFAVTAFTASAATPFDGLEISIFTDKDKYAQGEDISATLKVKNTNDSPVTNLKLEMQVPDGFKTEKDAELTKDFPVLDKGVSGALKVSYLSVDAGLSKIILLSCVLGAVLVGAFAMILIYIIRNRKTKQVLSVFLCLLMVGSLVFPVFASEALENVKDDRNVLNVTKTVKVGGKELELSARVYYDEITSTLKNITVSTEDMLYDEPTDTYYVLTPLTTLSGLLQNTENVKSATCKVSDANGKVLFEKHFKSAHAWTVEGFGMVIGINTVDITVEYKDGTVNTSSLRINNVCEENMETIEVDKEDNDGDGVLNFIEELYHTNLNKADSDGDGLSDYIEMAILGTAALLVDSDDNGTSDADEDADNDGLSNLDEIETYETDPIIADTDGDLISDSEEVHTYSTNPIVADTDNDGREDKWEIDNGYDPLVENTDLPPIHTVVPDNVQVESAGSVSVTIVTDDSLINEETPGYIGEDPIKVELEDGQSATVTIDYDSSALGEGETPTLYYLNEETQCYEPVETTVDENGSATATVTKNGVYVLLNHRYVDEVWDNDIFSPSENADDGAIDVVFVIDRSQSMDSNDPNEIRKAVTKEFISKLRDGTDRAAIVQFTSVAETVSPLTTDKEALCNAVDGIVNSDGGGCSGTDSTAGTNGSAGIRQALTELTGSTAPHKYIIFLTDGEDTSVSEDYGDELGTTGLTGEAKAAGIIIHTVGLIGTGDVDVDLLKRVAQGTGGNYYVATMGEEAENENELVQIYDELESVTIDRKNDTNEDLISDYYTRVICNGDLTTATGMTHLFGSGTYDKVQENADFDGDGIINGEELVVTESANGVYVKIISYPFSSDSDNDGLTDPFELRITSSPIKKNASADISDTDWLTNSENFISDEYLDMYNESVWERGSVWIGNAFFGTTLDQTVLYKKALVDYFNAIDANLVSEAEIKNYKDLAATYIDASMEEIKNSIINKHLSGDTEGAKLDLEDLYNLVDDFVDLDSVVSDTSDLAAGYDNIFLELANLSANADVKYYDHLIDMVRDNMSAVPGIIDNDSKEFWNSYLDDLSGLLYEYGTQKGLAENKITLRLSKFNDFSKKLEGVGKIVDYIDYGMTAWDTYSDYCSLLASMETIEANIYVLDCIKASSHNSYLSSAARELSFYMNDAYSSQTRTFTAQLNSIAEGGVSIALEVLHGLAADSGIPVLVAVELVRTFGNLFFDLDEVSEASAKTVALALSADILAENFQDHLDGGYAIEADGMWVGYADYSDSMYKTLLNLIELRKQAEDQMKERKDGNDVTELCDSNIEKCNSLISKYNEKYFDYYLN